MEKYQVYLIESFEKLFYTLDKSEQQWIDKTKKKLEENPTGKILTFSWFREKKYLNKRLYFLIDENTKKILLISFASKKEQQNIIAFIKTNMKELMDYLRNL